MNKLLWAIAKGIGWATCIFIILGSFISIILGIAWAFSYSMPAGLAAIFVALAVLIAVCQYDSAA